MIDKIIKEKIPCYFISPHLDDAVFSAGGLLSQLQGKTKTIVINVFTNAGDSYNTYSAKAYLRQCGVADPSKLFKKRINEDGIALKSLGVKVINLDHTDAMWRKFTTRRLGIAELTSNYPTYRFHVVSGRLSPFDKPLIADLAGELKKLITDKKFYVFCPVGFGNHADHLLVRQVCHDTFSSEQLLYWSDFPYYFRNPGRNTFITQNNLDEIVVGHVGKEKLKACKLYKTQFSAVITDESMVNNPEIFYHSLVGELPKLTLK